MAEDYRHKVICDPVHGDIGLSALEEQVIDSPSFQRLRNLKQLGLATLVYPNASHSRFAHSLGVFRIMSRIIDLLVDKGKFTDADRRIMRIAALVHDIGHYPYSHLMEFVDRDRHRASYLVKPKADKAPPSAPKLERYPDHEKIGQLVITQREDIFNPLKENGVAPEEIAAIIRGEHTRQAFNQLIHSSLDMDRMDYLVRDSLGTGVPYGKIDLHYLLSNLDVTDAGEVVVSYKAAAAAEHFLVARYFMYKTVYMHKTIFGFEALLRHILFLLREHGFIYRDGTEIERLVLKDEFLDFHDGRLWLVSRCPADGQYYFACALWIAQLIHNAPDCDKATRFGEYAILADRATSGDLGRSFPAEGLLRAFTFETGRPIKYGSSIGQSLQTLRMLDPADERILDAALADLAKGEAVPLAGSAGLWTKCDSVFADYFLKNRSRRHEPLAFLLYDPPPALRPCASWPASAKPNSWPATSPPSSRTSASLSANASGKLTAPARSTRRPRRTSTSSGTRSTACISAIRAQCTPHPGGSLGSKPSRSEGRFWAHAAGCRSLTGAFGRVILRQLIVGVR